MKALMYHYIRLGSEELPYFRYLHIEDFKAQLDHLAENYKFISKEEFLLSLKTKIPIENGVLLTFDDGLADHYQVMKELVSRDLWGIFYIPTGCYESKTLIDVHRVHMLIGKFGGIKILDALKEIVTEDMVSSDNELKFRDLTYSLQKNDKATMQVKKILNYYINNDVKDKVLKELMDRFFANEAELMNEYYLTEAQIKEMHGAGMIIGSHSVTHPVFSKLSYKEQFSEIHGSFSYIEKIIGSFEIKTFCYPYGGDHVFTQETIDILTNENSVFSFSVEQKEIDSIDLKNRRQALPRYDCNQFMYGKASMGNKRPEQFL